MYCGILPYIISDDNNIYLLIGFEPRGYSEFGGGAEGDDYKQQAIREFHEETHGLFLHLNTELERLTDDDIIHCSNTAVVYGYQLPLSTNEAELCVTCYNNMFKLLIEHKVDNYLPDHSGLFEKLELMLVHMDDVEIYRLSYYFKLHLPTVKQWLLNKLVNC